MSRHAPSRYGTLDDLPEAGAAGADGLLDLRSIWYFLRRRIGTIAMIGALAVAATAAGVLVFPAQYKATTVVLVDPRQPRVTYSDSVLSGIGSDAAAVESQVEVINSSALLARVIERLRLDQDPEFSRASFAERFTSGILGLLGRRAQDDPDLRLTRLVRRVQEDLDVRRRGLTYIIEITFASREAAKAAEIANAIAQAYLEDQRTAKLDATRRATNWLADRIAELRERVRVSEQAVADYKAAHNIVDVSEGNKLLARQIEELTQQIILARAAAAETDARLRQLKEVQSGSRNVDGLAESLKSQVIMQLRAQYAEVARNEAELSAAFGERHPALARIRAQLAGIKRQIDAEIARILAGVRNDDEVARNRLATLEAELARLKAQNAKYNSDDVRLRALQREADATRTLLEQFLARSKETSEQQSLQIADARVVSAALTPTRPNRPPLSLLLLAAAVIGAGLGTGLALILEHLERGYRTAAEVESDLRLPCLGLIPASACRAGTGTLAALIARLFRRKSLREAASPAAPPATPIAVLRALRARLRPDISGVHGVVAVLSSLAGEGKSMVARDLARESARAGVRTLLLELDPRVSPYGAEITPAIAELADKLRGTKADDRLIAPEPRTGLYVLTGRGHAALMEVLANLDRQKLTALLQQFKSVFELVILDGRAILDDTQASQLMQHADRALIVIAWKTTPRTAVAAALNRLDSAADKVAGIVLNKVDTGKYRLYDEGAADLIASSRAAGAPPAREAVPIPEPRAAS